MPANERAYQLQSAIYWERLSYDSYGQPTYKNPVQIPCRWDDSIKQNVSPNSASQGIDATLFVSQPIVVGSYMWKGTMSQLPSTGPIPDVMEVTYYSGIPDLKNRISAYKVNLMRSKTTDLPIL